MSPKSPGATPWPVPAPTPGPARGAAPGAASPDLVFAGNLLVDDLVFPDGRTRMGQAGGAMVYSSLGAALWGARVGVASVAGTDYPPDTLEALAARGVDLAGVRRLDRPGLRTWLLYEKGGRRVLHRLGSPSHVEVSPTPDQLDSAYPAARAFHLSPMPIEVQRALVAGLARRKGVFVSLDPHQPVREDNLAEWLEILKDVDMFFAGEDELQLDGAHNDPYAALARLGVGRLEFAAFKRGAHGGLLWDRRSDRFHEWPPSPPPVVDHTGAGDAFAGGFLSGHLAGIGLETALERGVVSASFAIENWGARGLVAATVEGAERRRARFPSLRGGA